MAGSGVLIYPLSEGKFMPSTGSGNNLPKSKGVIINLLDTDHVDCVNLKTFKQKARSIPFAPSRIGETGVRRTSVPLDEVLSPMRGNSSQREET
jgi:hypothetical protein